MSGVSRDVSMGYRGSFDEVQQKDTDALATQ